MRFSRLVAGLFGLMCWVGAAADELPVPLKGSAGQATSGPCVYKTKDTEYPARCGVIFVPENRTKPGSRLIALPFKRILARTRTPAEPLFELAGGPGMTNLSSDLPVSWIVGARDIVLLGYRGVDGTVQLDCPELDAIMRGGGEVLTPAAHKKLAAAYRQCAVRVTAAGIDLGGYTILEVVDDIEALRRVLDFDRIDLSSVSYGTRVALVYGWRYPERVHRSVMIGVNPPGGFSFEPARLDAQLRRYAALCTADAYCRSRTHDLYGDIRHALDNMPKHWLGFPVNRDIVLVGTFMALFTVNGAASTFDMWIDAAHGDYSGMALLTAVYPMILPKGMLWGDHAAKASSVDFEPGSVCSPDIQPGGRYLLGSPLNVLACAASDVWPMHKIPAEYRAVRASDVETLMLSGTLDVSTPAENARDKLLPVMKNARQVTLAEFSHAGDLIYAEPEATRRLVTGFLQTGKVDVSLYRHRPVNFDPGWMRFGLMAKGLLGVAVLAAGGLAWLGFWLVRRRRRPGRAAA